MVLVSATILQWGGNDIILQALVTFLRANKLGYFPNQLPGLIEVDQW